MQKFFRIFFVISTFFSAFAFSNSLYISEVFFDGWDEWIEIYNAGSNDFSGDLMFSGTDNFTLENIYIDSGNFLVLGETQEFDFSNNFKIFSGQSLSISDSSAINLNLIYSGQILDKFQLKKNIVKGLNDQNKSFQKVFSGDEIYITGTRQKDKKNISGDVIGNPGKIKYYSNNNEENDNNENEEEFEENDNGNKDNSGNNSSNIGYHDLKIIEIFPKDNSYYPEFFVLKAFQDFSGTVYGTGLWWGDSQKSFDLHILSGEKTIIADNSKKIKTGSDFKKIFQNISLGDNGEVVSLYVGTGTLIDRIQYTGAKENKSIFYSGNLNSGENIRKFDFYSSPTPSVDLNPPDSCEMSIQGKLNNHKANVIVTGIQNFHCGKNFQRKWFNNDLQISGNNCHNTIELISGENNIEFQLLSGNQTLCKVNQLIYNISDKSKNLFGGDLKITEIYPYDKNGFNEYIELKALGNFSGNLQIAGLGRGDVSKNLKIQLYSGNYLVISDSYSGFVNTGNVYKFSSISLKNGGEKISLYGQDGHVLDRINYKEINNYKSHYFQYISGDIRFFGNQNSPTPGFGKDKLQYFVENDSNNYSNNDCYIKLQNNDTIFSNNSVNFISVLNGEELQNSSEYNCKINLGNGKIIKKCNPYYIKYSSSNIYKLNLEIYKNGKKICSSKKTLNLPKESKENSNCNNSSCKEDYYEDLYHKRKTRYKDLKDKKQEKEKYVQSNLQISAVLPNPEGRDGDKEVLKIKNIGNNKIDLNKYFLEYGRRKFYLSDILDTIGANETKILTGKFKFYNRSECLFLKKEGKNKNIYDHFCYQNPESGKLISNSFDFLSKFKDMSILSNFDVKLLKEKSQNCFFYNDRQIFCKDVDLVSNNKKDKNGKKKQGILEITSILPDPKGKDYGREKIKIRLLTGDRQFEDFYLFYGGKKKYIDLNFSGNKTLELSGTFLFLNDTNCVSLKKSGIVYDKFCYLNPQEGKYVKDLDVLHEIQDISIFSDLKITRKQQKICLEYKNTDIFCDKFDLKLNESKNNQKTTKAKTEKLKNIEMVEIFPNPEGRDQDKEYIVLKNNENNPVNLSGYEIKYGKRSYELDGKIKLDYRKIKGKLKLYNRPSCIKLISKSRQTIDKFCYLNPKSGKIINNSKNFLNNFKDISILSQLDIEKIDKESCLYYKNNKLFCKDVIVGSVEEFKEKIKSLEKDIISQNNKIDKLQKNIDNYKNKVKLRDNFIDFVIDKLQNEWYVVFKKSGLDKIKKTYDKLKDKLEKGKQYTTVNYMNIRLTKIKDINKAKSGAVFLHKLPDYVWNKYFVSNIPNKLFDFLTK